MSYYVYETQYQNPRKCKECGNGMAEGYLHEWEEETFCSPRCATFNYGPIDFTDLLDSGVLFWTTWYDEVEEEE